MKFYCGIDLSARDCHVCVIDEQLKIMVQQKLRNDLAKVCQLLEATSCEPAWLFGAVHSRAELRVGLVRPKTPAALVPPTRLWAILRNAAWSEVECSA